ncbi:MAG: hypothetical protein IPO44_16895 [Candidatus Microthrix sp.]|nr:hypothetical protein [Candidatus Microthrix sp.]MBK9561158.1 hypothetical protein [Candidatus Microthrix sp.]
MKIGGHILELNLPAPHREDDLSGHHLCRILRGVLHAQIRGDQLAVKLALQSQHREDVGAGARLFVKRVDRVQHLCIPLKEVITLLLGEARDPLAASICANADAENASSASRSTDNSAGATCRSSATAAASSSRLPNPTLIELVTSSTSDSGAQNPGTTTGGSSWAPAAVGTNSALSTITAETITPQKPKRPKP